MSSLIYNFFLLLSLLNPRRGKIPLSARLGLHCPDPQGKPLFWIHAVSVGEVRAAIPFVETLRAEQPDVFLFMTVTTATGLAEAKRSLPFVDAHSFFPLDLSWVWRRWMKQLQPKALFFIETDLWPNLISYAKKQKTKLFLLSGKMSPRSAQRLSRFRFFARPFFSSFDAILVQNQEHFARFLPLMADPSRLSIGGNLKWSAKPVLVDPSFASEFPPLSIAITSTHAPEEEELITLLSPLQATLFLAPRHPERFRVVEEMLQRKKIYYVCWSQRAKKTGQEKVVLVDQMGQLPILYSYCQVAIVGGSFSSKVGGHNVWEPCLYGTPVFFGPSMEHQRELASTLLAAGAAKQYSGLPLLEAIRDHLAVPEGMKGKVVEARRSSQDAIEITWAAVERALGKGSG